MKEGTLLRFNEKQKNFNPEYIGFFAVVEEIINATTIRIRTNRPSNPCAHNTEETSIVGELGARFDIIEE